MKLPILLATLPLYPILTVAHPFWMQLPWLPAAPSTTSYSEVTTYKTTTVTNYYPNFDRSPCQTSGPQQNEGPLCKNSCMARYLTPKPLPAITWWQDGTLTNASLTWSAARWGDADGKHVPLALQASSHVQTALSHDAYRDRVYMSMLAYHTSGADAEGMSSTAAARARAGWRGPVGPAPTLLVQTLHGLTTATPTFAEAPAKTTTTRTTQCTPTFRDRVHTAVEVRATGTKGRTASSMLVPTNPACDKVDPTGWTDGEKLWLYQNGKSRARRAGEGQVECFHFESCWDHCEGVRRAEHRLRYVLLGLLGALGLLAAVGVCVVKCLRRSRREKAEEREKEQARKWGGESRPAAVAAAEPPADVEQERRRPPDIQVEQHQNPDQHEQQQQQQQHVEQRRYPADVDGAADGADERSARRAASLFRAAVSRREAISTGSETVPGEDGVVRRG